MLIDILFFTAGMAMLYFGADWLVKGSSAIALRTGISPLIIGLTLVALATSAPELVVSLQAAFMGNPSVAVGNVAGSNIANISLVLGATALIWPVVADSRTLKFEMPIMVAVCVIFFLMMLNGFVSRPEGIVLVVLLSGLTIYQIRLIRKGYNIGDIPDELEEVISEDQINTLASIIKIVAGGAFLILGSDLFVKGAVSIGTKAGISDAVIGLTIVSLGTSLPELATCVVAAFRKKSDIALGNVIGSNIFNVLAILGITATAHPLTAEGVTNTDMILMLFLAVIIWPMMRTKMKISRIEGGFLLTIYISYIIYLLR